MTDKKTLIELLTKISSPEDNKQVEFWRIENDGNITIIGSDLQEINFQFDSEDNLIWYE